MNQRQLHRGPAAAPTLVIHEIYRSIQGETTFSGRACTLVRLSACNLRCRWCDTPQAFEGGTRMPVADVATRALSLSTPLVLVTGGEPLLQPAVHDLLRALCDSGREVLLETSGERDISAVDPRVHRIVDFKAPGSGEVAKNRWDNVAHLSRRDQVKLVLADRQDYEWAREQIVTRGLPDRVAAVLLSPVHGELDPRELVAWMLEDGLDATLQLQLHKLIWGAEAQGV